MEGNSSVPYIVKITLDQRNSTRRILVSCTCPYARDWPGEFCKHHVAAILELANHLNRRPKKIDWRTTLQDALDERLPGKKPSTRRLLFVLEGELDGWEMVASSVDLAELGLSQDADPDEIFRAADGDERTTEVLITSYSNGSPLVRTPDEDAALRMLMDRRRTYYSASTPLTTIFPLLTGALVAYRRGDADRLEQVRVAERIARPELELVAEGDTYILRRQVRLGDETVTIEPGRAMLVADRPPWVFAQSHLFQVDDRSGLLGWFLDSATVQTSGDDLAELMTSYIVPLSERLPVISDKLQICDRIEGEPSPRVYLTEDAGKLTVWLRFGYGGAEAPFSSAYPQTSRWYDPERQGLVELTRDSAKERDWYDTLYQHGLKKGQQKDSLQLKQSVGPAEFLIQKAPQLVSLGFEVFGEENLTSVKVNRRSPKLSMSVSSGIDWFDVQAVVSFGETSASLKDMRRAIRRGQSYIKLADGSIGYIPDEWLERYRRVFALAEETAEGLRLSKTQAALLDGLIKESDQTRLDEDVRRNREKLRSAHVLDAKALPQGLHAELRPYQKHGYDWLRFLHENRFGGCLADDMGIGKTVQALAFVQWLQKSAGTRHASLVVAPRSVVENWRREAERFTPELRVHLHTELDRTRVAAIFDDFDLIVTTYGLMRRDVTMLAGYPFEMVILDESQAIKNPASDTARAARSLNTAHRLALTGTPVENNTLELWSQFAFLNPGMLGTMEAFKSEFASPIEKRENADAAKELRKMVRPFILRRTKQQVAPELPERTESVVYCEMDAAQRKLYERTRDSYRAQLLGMIEQQGMNKSRMRVLEGLLRLRQICNHPQLVDKAYHGVSAKLEALLEILETVRSEGHKALVFSQFTQMLAVVRRELDRLKTPYAYLDGRTKNRQEIVDGFQAGDSASLFLISLKAGGVGLNLTAADYVVHIDPWWNPAVEQQASDRTHRIGQTKPVFIQKLIARETVEEKMLELQKRKRDLVDKLISSESSFFKSLSAEDVAELFS